MNYEYELVKKSEWNLMASDLTEVRQIGPDSAELKFCSSKKLTSPYSSPPLHVKAISLYAHKQQENHICKYIYNSPKVKFFKSSVCEVIVSSLVDIPLSFYFMVI